MVISSLDLAAKSELTFLAELVADLRAAAPAWKPLLVGAMARDLLLYYAHNIPVGRATEDIDLEFAVADWGGILPLCGPRYLHPLISKPTDHWSTDFLIDGTARLTSSHLTDWSGPTVP